MIILSSVLPDCGDPGRPNNATVIGKNHWAGEYVRYLCHPGYTMLGPAVRMCLSSGKWSGKAPNCKSYMRCIFFFSIFFICNHTTTLMTTTTKCKRKKNQRNEKTVHSLQGLRVQN